MSKLETNTIDTISGSTNLTLGGTNATDITIPSGVTITNNGTQSGFGGTNTPAFFAKLGSSQSISSNTDTVVQFNTEYIDSDSKYDTSTYKFTPSAGTYLIGFNVAIIPSSASLRQFVGRIRKNDTGNTVAGSGIYSSSSIYENGAPSWFNGTGIAEANGTDYFTVKVYGYDSGFTVQAENYPCYFYAFKIIE